MNSFYPCTASRSWFIIKQNFSPVYPRVLFKNHKTLIFSHAWELFSYCVLLVISFLCEKMFGNSSLCGQNEKYFFKNWKMFSLWERWQIGDQKSRLAMGNHHKPASSQLPSLFEKTSLWQLLQLKTTKRSYVKKIKLCVCVNNLIL